MASIKLFGFKIGKDDPKQDQLKSFVPPSEDDQSSVSVVGGGVYGTYVDLEGQIRTDADLIKKYREMALQAECDSAIDDVVNEAIVYEEGTYPVTVVLDNLKQPESIKKKVRDEFEHIMKLLDFNNQGYEIFRRWYIDGRLYYHMIIDEKQPRMGLKEVRYIDPRKIRKVREMPKTQPGLNPTGQQAQYLKPIEYFVFSDKGFVRDTNQGLKISADSICYVHSGLSDKDGKAIVSYLHKAIKPLNQLRMLEDATVIYRISRAPERRIFYIDVGNLPKMKAEQYLREIMQKYKNKLVYDASTGEIRDDRRFQTMLEDFWLPRREGGKGTEITTLPAGQNLGEIDDVLYFQKKLFKALNVPISRLEADNGFSLGRSSEITRDEVKFAKFVNRLRRKFNKLVSEA
ncbi:portal protein [bacterium]|nr:portal protein [Candidatus Elulimicrobium humile]